MPMIKYRCHNKDCRHSFSTFIGAGVEPKESLTCKSCGTENSAKRTLSGPTSSSKISIDNGVQARAVEVDPDIMELRVDWAKPPNRGD